MEDIHQIINVNQIKELAKTWLINKSHKGKNNFNTVEQLFAAV